MSSEKKTPARKSLVGGWSQVVFGSWLGGGGDKPESPPQAKEDGRSQSQRSAKRLKVSSPIAKLELRPPVDTSTRQEDYVVDVEEDRKPPARVIPPSYGGPSYANNSSSYSNNHFDGSATVNYGEPRNSSTAFGTSSSAMVPRGLEMVGRSAWKTQAMNSQQPEQLPQFQLSTTRTPSRSHTADFAAENERRLTATEPSKRTRHSTTTMSAARVPSRRRFTRFQPSPRMLSASIAAKKKSSSGGDPYEGLKEALRTLRESPATSQVFENKRDPSSIIVMRNGRSLNGLGDGASRYPSRLWRPIESRQTDASALEKGDRDGERAAGGAVGDDRGTRMSKASAPANRKDRQVTFRGATTNVLRDNDDDRVSTDNHYDDNDEDTKQFQETRQQQRERPNQPSSLLGMSSPDSTMTHGSSSSSKQFEPLPQIPACPPLGPFLEFETDNDAQEEMEDEDELLVKEVERMNPTRTTPIIKKKLRLEKNTGTGRMIKCLDVELYKSAVTRSTAVVGQNKKTPSEDDEDDQQMQKKRKIMNDGDSWTCKKCQKMNPNDESACLGCKEYRSSVLQTKGFGNLFGAQATLYRCKTCLLQYDRSRTKCPACETPREDVQAAGSEPNAQRSTNANQPPASIGASGFTFGAPSVSAPVAAATSTSASGSGGSKFSFGASAQQTGGTSTGNGGATFSLGSAMQQPSDTSKGNAMAQLSFGGAPGLKEKGESASGFTKPFVFSAAPPSDNVKPAPAPAPAPFSFGAPPVQKPAESSNANAIFNTEPSSKTDTKTKPPASGGLFFGNGSSSGSQASKPDTDSKPPGSTFRSESQPVAQENNSAPSLPSGALFGLSSRATTAPPKSNEEAELKSSVGKFSFGTSSNSAAQFTGTSVPAPPAPQTSEPTNGAPKPMFGSFGSGSNKDAAESIPAAPFRFGATVESTHQPESSAAKQGFTVASNSTQPVGVSGDSGPSKSSGASFVFGAAPPPLSVPASTANQVPTGFSTAPQQFGSAAFSQGQQKEDDDIQGKKRRSMNNDSRDNISAPFSSAASGFGQGGAGSSSSGMFQFGSNPEPAPAPAASTSFSFGSGSQNSAPAPSFQFGVSSQPPLHQSSGFPASQPTQAQPIPQLFGQSQGPASQPFGAPAPSFPFGSSTGVPTSAPPNPPFGAPLNPPPFGGGLNAPPAPSFGGAPNAPPLFGGAPAPPPPSFGGAPNPISAQSFGGAPTNAFNNSGGQMGFGQPQAPVSNFGAPGGFGAPPGDGGFQLGTAAKTRGPAGRRIVKARRPTPGARP